MNRKFRGKCGAVCALICGFWLSSATFGQDLPDGTGKAELIHNCTACHGADLVIRVKKTPDEWKKNVADMAARGTDGTPEDLDKVVQYLVKNYSTDKLATSASSSTTDTDHAKQLISANGCLACHRIEKDGGHIAPSLNGVGKRHTLDEIRAAIVNPKSPMPSYLEKIKGDDLDSLVRYLASLPAVDDTAPK